MSSRTGKIIDLYENSKRTDGKTMPAQSSPETEDDIRLSTRTVLSRIKGELGLDTDQELADVMGISVRRIHNWKLRNTVPTEEIVAICGKEGLDLQYILTGQGARPNRADEQSETSGAQAKHGACTFDAEQANKPRDTFTHALCGHPRIHPPYRAYTQRTENGEILTSFTSPQIVDVLAPGINWLNHSLGVSPENFLLIKVLGDDMVPWVQDGDLVIVDTGLKTATNGGCVVLRYADGLLMVRRVFRNPDGTLLAKCDSECSAPDIIDPNDNMIYPIVVGRVVRRLIK